MSPGVGAGGTIARRGTLSQAALSADRIVLADPVGSALARWATEGRRAAAIAPPYKVEGIGSSRRSRLSSVAPAHRWGRNTVSDADGFAMVHRLIREEGLLVGGSAGTAVVAALRVAARSSGPDPVVVLLPDSWDRYLTCSLGVGGSRRLNSRMKRIRGKWRCGSRTAGAGVRVSSVVQQQQRAGAQEDRTDGGGVDGRIQVV